jgi:hypothetical protein
MKLKFKKRLLFNYPDIFLLLPSILRVKNYTKQGLVSLKQMHDFIKSIDRRKVGGALVELGCANGGTGALMARWSQRPTWLFDGFKGLIESAYDKHMINEKNVRPTKDNVLEALRLSGAEARVIDGMVEDTVPKHKQEIGPIAILRLDLDIYEPIKFCLDELFDQVTQGGYVVIDDYKSWEGCRKALYEFFVERNYNPVIWDYPFGGRAYIIKN